MGFGDWDTYKTVSNITYNFHKFRCYSVNETNRVDLTKRKAAYEVERTGEKIQSGLEGNGDPLGNWEDEKHMIKHSHS